LIAAIIGQDHILRLRSSMKGRSSGRAGLSVVTKPLRAPQAGNGAQESRSFRNAGRRGASETAISTRSANKQGRTRSTFKRRFRSLRIIARDPRWFFIFAASLLDSKPPLGKK